MRSAPLERDVDGEGRRGEGRREGERGGRGGESEGRGGGGEGEGGEERNHNHHSNPKDAVSSGGHLHTNCCPCSVWLILCSSSSNWCRKVPSNSCFCGSLLKSWRASPTNSTWCEREGERGEEGREQWEGRGGEGGREGREG